MLGDNRNNSHDSRMWNMGQGGGVPFGNTLGRLRGHEVPELPANAEGAAALAPAIADCLAKRPSQTTPPPRSEPAARGPGPAGRGESSGSSEEGAGEVDLRCL